MAAENASSISIPAGSVVRFSGSVTDALKKYSDAGYFMLAEDIQISLSSQYSRLVDGTSPTFFRALAGVTGSLFSFSFSGAYKQLGLEIWESSEPLALSFSVDLVMRMDAVEEVLNPMIELCTLPLPEDKGGVQGLVPPGPNVLAAFTGNGEKTPEKLKAAANNGIVTIDVGGFSFPEMVIKNAVPVVSRYPARDEQGRMAPIYAKVQVDAQGIWTATKQTVRRLAGTQQ